MVSSTIDHMVAVTIFLAATLLFIGLFNQTIQTAVLYQNHRATATKASDLLDIMMLNPGAPIDWGQKVGAPSGFGLQDPEFTQYVLNPFSLTRLNPLYGTPVYYSKTNNATGMNYGNLSMNAGSYLMMPYSTVLNYTTASKLLGVNGTYGFQLTLTPIIDITVKQTQTNPLRLSINVQGTGFPLANAQVNYYLVLASLTSGGLNCPGYTSITGTVITDTQGSASVQFTNITSSNPTYVFVAYAHLSGINGIGYCVNSASQDQSIIPFIGDLSQRTVLLAHNLDVNNFGTPVDESSISYNATMLILTEDFNLRELPLQYSSGNVTTGPGYPYGEITVPSYNSGILIVTYNSSTVNSGIAIMPWGLGSLACSLTFGGDPSNQEWVSTDMRQVVVGNIAYQAKLAVWSYQGIQVKG
jgi:hypothetical protein